VAVPKAYAICERDTPHALAIVFKVRERSELRSITQRALSVIDMIDSSLCSEVNLATAGARCLIDRPTRRCGKPLN